MTLKTVFAVLGVALCGFVAKADAPSPVGNTLALSGEVTLDKD